MKTLRQLQEEYGTLTNGTIPDTEEVCLNDMRKRILDWAEEKGILEKATPISQFAKGVEETGELAKAILEELPMQQRDGIGDRFVVDVILSHLLGHNMGSCVAEVVGIITQRNGKMNEQGVFVRDK